jgi:hypothetical protein
LCQPADADNIPGDTFFVVTGRLPEEPYLEPLDFYAMED